MPSELSKKVGRGEIRFREATRETRRLFEESLLGGDARGVARYLGKGGPWRGVWDDEETFARMRAKNSHHYSLEEHFLWVNGCGLDALVRHVEEAAELCFRRSQRIWHVDLGEFARPNTAPEERTSRRSRPGS